MNGRERGFGIIAAIVILVILTTISAGLVRLGTTQQVISAQDILSARAFQVARAGNEWGLYQALKNSECWIGSATLDLRASNGFLATVTCTQKQFNEAGVTQPITTYYIEAVACNSNSIVGVCPDAAAWDSNSNPAGYIERKRVVMANTP